MNNRLRSFFRYVIPSVISMMSMAVFTVVDGIFVSRGVGSQALAAVNVVYPVILLLTAIAAMLALGVSTMISERLALGKKEETNAAFMNCNYAGTAAFILIALITIPFARPIVAALGADGVILEHAVSYLRAYMCFALPAGAVTILAAAVRNDNNPSIASVSLIISSVANIVGDWLFVYPLHMGVAGAAIATGLSQVLGVAILLYHFVAKKGALRFTLRERPQLAECRRMIRRGFPECINQLTVPVITVCYNLVLSSYLGDRGLEAYALISQPISIVIIMLLGVADGTQPLFSHSYSVGDHDANRYYFKKAIQMNVILSVVIYVLFFFFGKVVFGIFSSDAELLELAMRGNRLYSLNFLFASVTMVISCYFMSIVYTKYANLINACRTFVFNVLFIFVTPLVMGAGTLWAGIVVAELATMLMAVALYRRYKRQAKLA